MSALQTGYEVIDLHGKAHLNMRDALYMQCEYGLHAYRNHTTDRHVSMMKFVHKQPHWLTILKDNFDKLVPVVGQNIMYQREPYLRIARPGMKEDQIGIHRDSHYGASDKEWVLWIPMTDATNGAEMRIIPGSHLESDEAYPWTEIQTGVVRGSPRHWLGFPYTYKKMSHEVESATIPVPCKLGQAILFNSACVHGQEVNRASWTRFTIDIRLVDADADINWDRGVHGDIYATLMKDAA